MTAPRFDHSDAGRPEAAWRALGVWDDLPPVTLGDAGGARPDRLVVVVAHPDDETLAMAGLLSWATDEDLPCHLVVATDGEGSHPHSPTHPPERLAEVRRRELVLAVQALAPSARVTRLEVPDGEVAGCAAAVEEALVDLVDGHTLLVSTWRHDAHADHEAVALVAARVAAGVGARHLEAPIWLWHWGSPVDVPWRDCLRLDLDEDAVDRRARALAAYASQHTALSPHPADAPVLGPRVLAHFDRSFEVYVEHAPEPGAGTTTGVFERLHTASADPWSLGDSWYERRKRDLTLAALPSEHLGRILEVGCSVGVLTAELAHRAEEVVAIDVSPAALDQARLLVREAAVGDRVRLERRRVPQEWPEGTFDVVVLSEVGYFLTRPQWTEVVDRALTCARDGVLLVHWRHPVEGWPLDGPVCHELARASAGPRGYRVTTSVVDDDFLLDLVRREERPGIAMLDGKT